MIIVGGPEGHQRRKEIEPSLFGKSMAAWLNGTLDQSAPDWNSLSQMPAFFQVVIYSLMCM